MTSQKTEFMKFPRDRLHIQKEQDEKCSLAKNQPVSANWRGVINIVMLQCLRCKPILERFVLSHQSINVLKWLISWHGGFFILLSEYAIQPIISQI